MWLVWLRNWIYFTLISFHGHSCSWQVATVLDSAILEAVLSLSTRVRLNFWLHETFIFPFPRVFCKCLATAFQIPILPPWSSSKPGSEILPEGLGACTQCAMTGSQVKLIMVIIFIIRNSSINSNRFLCLLYPGTSHTHRKRETVQRN